VVAGAGTELAGCRMQPSVALAGGGGFSECVGHLWRQLRESARGGSARKREIGPQMAEHFREVRLAAAVEARYPHARLFRPVAQIAQEGIEDGFHPFLVLAVANEGFEFMAQHLLGGIRVVFGDFGNPVVDRPILFGRFDVHIAIQHGGVSQSSYSLAISGTAR
jgi:hypothetical protein